MSRTSLRGGHASDYQLKRPDFAGELTFSPGGLGKTDISGGQNIWARGIHFSLDYQPPFFQTFGVLAFGPEMNIYPVLPMNPGVASSIYSTWAYGGEIRYQARFFREQLLVPVVGYDYEHLMYHLNTLGSGSFTMSGAIYGVYILMNQLEPTAAYDIYDNAGILRTYLTVEARNLRGTGSQLAVGGTSYFGGIRMEF